MLAPVKLASFIERKYVPLGFVVFVIMYFYSLISTVLHQTATFLTLKCIF